MISLVQPEEPPVAMPPIHVGKMYTVLWLYPVHVHPVPPPPDADGVPDDLPDVPPVAADSKSILYWSILITI